MTKRPLTEEEYVELAKYAETHGRNWKAQLRADWMACRTIGVLHRLRNTHGPSWLAKFKFENHS